MDARVRWMSGYSLLLLPVICCDGHDGTMGSAPLSRQRIFNGDGRSGWAARSMPSSNQYREGGFEYSFQSQRNESGCSRRDNNAAWRRPIIVQKSSLRQHLFDVPSPSSVVWTWKIPNQCSISVLICKVTPVVERFPKHSVFLSNSSIDESFRQKRCFEPRNVRGRPAVAPVELAQGGRLPVPVESTHAEGEMRERTEKRQDQTRANEIFAATILRWVRSEAAARVFLEQRRRR